MMQINVTHQYADYILGLQAPLVLFISNGTANMKITNIGIVVLLRVCENL